MNISQAGLNAIKQYEGYSGTTYLDVAGKATIGYGHLLKQGESYPDGITEEQAEALLLADLTDAQNAVNAMVKVPLTQNQFDALVSFAYNLGAAALDGSTLLADLNKGDYADAANQFPLWDHSNHQVVQGLLARRKAEQSMFLGNGPAN
jgi:lysozyme